MSRTPDPARPLREGFTTGSAATAAVTAALRFLLTGAADAQVDIPAPPGARCQRRLTIPVAGLERLGPDTALAAVIKDGGDDPDATHRARIEACVRFTPGATTELELTGGRGVGRVTLPGLPVAVGEAAINPGPRAQLALAVSETCAVAACPGTVRATINVPEGERIAARTLNARLGIVGGISILGTQGTVRPYSHSAWRGTITQALDVAQALGCAGIGLCSGRRSERLLMRALPAWPEQAFVQAADYAGFAVHAAARCGFALVEWGGFFGKLLKLAQGHAFTHARAAALDMPGLAAMCAGHGLARDRCAAIGGANTAAQALDIMHGDPAAPQLLHALAGQAHATLARCVRHGRLRIGIRLFHADGEELVHYQPEQ